MTPRSGVRAQLKTLGVVTAGLAVALGATAVGVGLRGNPADSRLAAPTATGVSAEGDEHSESGEVTVHDDSDGHHDSDGSAAGTGSTTSSASSTSTSDDHPHTTSTGTPSAATTPPDGGDGHAHAGTTDDGHQHSGTGPTPAQYERALTLLRQTRATAPRFSDPATARAAGYTSIGDSITGFEHYVHAGYLSDGAILDPNRIESLVYEVNRGTGARTFASAMYILEPGATMADVPDVGGPLTVWHDHQNLCWDDSGVRLAGIAINGRCTRGTLRPTPPMLHVWMTTQPCGPFAGIEGTHGSGCDHGH